MNETEHETDSTGTSPYPEQDTSQGTGQQTGNNKQTEDEENERRTMEKGNG